MSSRLLVMVCATAMLHQTAGKADLSTGSSAPSYTAASVVNAASQTAGTLAPNTIATIYGTNLAFTTHAVTAADMKNGALPTSLDGVSVYVYNTLCTLFYVSPGQINFIVPYELTGSNVPLVVARQGVAGPIVTIPLAPTDPAFFQWNGNLAIAIHGADGSLITPSAPAHSSETIVLFAAGLGRTSPDVASGRPASTATWILQKPPQLQLLLNGKACDPSSILYAGVTPGLAGLYQINLRLPDSLPPNPEIRMAIGSQASPASIILPLQ